MSFYLCRIFLVILFLFSGCKKAVKPSAMPPVPVTAVRIEPETIPADFEFIGVAESSHIVQLRARVEGYLESINYKEGGFVHKNELMFVLDERPFIAEVESRIGELMRQQAILWNAEQTKARMIPLYEQNAVSQKDYDNAIASELAAKASVETAKANLTQAELNLEFARIASPVNGMASQAKYREGALISPEENLLTTIYVIDPIWINFAVSDQDLLKFRDEIKKGYLKYPDDLNFSIEAVLSDGSALPAVGKIDFTDPAIQQSTGTMLIRAVLPNPDKLIYPGQFAQVIVKGAVRPSAIFVPQSAVVQGESGAFVYVIEKGRAISRPVELGDWYGNSWIVYKGLEAGDMVIAEGVNKVQDKSSVVIARVVPNNGGK